MVLLLKRRSHCTAEINTRTEESKKGWAAQSMWRWFCWGWCWRISVSGKCGWALLGPYWRGFDVLGGSWSAEKWKTIRRQKKVMGKVKWRRTRWCWLHNDGTFLFYRWEEGDSHTAKGSWLYFVCHRKWSPVLVSQNEEGKPKIQQKLKNKESKWEEGWGDEKGRTKMLTLSAMVSPKKK